MKFFKKMTASASFGHFSFVGQDRWVQIEAKTVGHDKRFVWKCVGQAKWLSAKVNDPNFG